MMDNKQNNNNKFYKNQNFYVVLIVALCLIAATVVVVIRNGANDKLTDAPVNTTTEENDDLEQAESIFPQEGLGEIVDGEQKVEEKLNDKYMIVEEDKTIAESEKELTEEEVETNTNILSSFQNPVEGSMVYPFRNGIKGIVDPTDNKNKTPRGVGIKTEKGTEVKAVADGIVEAETKDKFFGETIVIKHGDNLKTVYSNLNENKMVKVGDKVKAGNVIGKVGDTTVYFKNMDSHLHFEVIESNAQYEDVMKEYGKDNFDSFVDPTKYLKLK